jgi:hypothetical protein
MSCLLFPKIDGIEVKVYNRFDQIIDIENVKCLLYFQSFRRRNKDKDKEFNSNSIEHLNSILKSVNNSLSFGGGCPKAIKSMNTSFNSINDTLNPYLIITFGGNRVKSSSIVLSTVNKTRYYRQLNEFKKELDFNCDHISESTTVAFLFANSDNFSPHFHNFTSAFQSVFPFVAIFGSNVWSLLLFGKLFHTNTHRKQY